MFFLLEILVHKDYKGIDIFIIQFFIFYRKFYGKNEQAKSNKKSGYSF